MDTVVLRPGTEEDVPFILNSWLKSYRSSPFAKPIDTETYYHYMHPIVSHCLERATVTVSALPDAPDTILGWSASEGNVLQYVYVKKRFRRTGIGTRMVKAWSKDVPKDSYYTAITGQGGLLLRSTGLEGSKYCPWLI